MQALSKDDSILLMIRLMLLIEDKLGRELAELRPGPTGKLSDLDILTIPAFDGLVERHGSLRGVYDYIAREYGDCFRLPAYQNFARRSRLLAPKISRLLKSLITKTETVFADSTPLSVCHPIRANHYRTLDRRSVGFGKNMMGFFFGFKLHLAVDKDGRLAGFHIGKGSHHDRRSAGKLLRALVFPSPIHTLDTISYSSEYTACGDNSYPLSSSHSCAEIEERHWPKLFYYNWERIS